MPGCANIPDRSPELPELAVQPVYLNPVREVFLIQPFQNWLIHPQNQKRMQKIAKTLLRSSFLDSTNGSILGLKKRQEKMCYFRKLHQSWTSKWCSMSMGFQELHWGTYIHPSRCA